MPFFLTFDVSRFNNLKELRICNNSIICEDVIVSILRKMRKKDIRIEYLDLSGNKASPQICKQIALLCRAVRTLSTVILDNTEIPLSGLVYLLMTTIDDSESGKKKKDDLNDLDRLLLDNNSINTAQ